MGKWTTYTVLRRWSTVACEEMFNILRHKENANQMTLSLHLTPVRMAITKKRNNNKCRWRFRDWECKLVQPLWKSVWRFLNKFKIELPHSCACIWRNVNQHTIVILHTHIYSSPIYNRKCMKWVYLSNNLWLDKENMVHIYNRVLFSHKEE
jgi:hypothetical protein